MSPELIRALVAGVVVGLTVLVLELVPGYRDTSRGKRALITMPVIFVVLLAFYMLWPS